MKNTLNNTIGKIQVHMSLILSGTCFLAIHNQLESDALWKIILHQENLKHFRRLDLSTPSVSVSEYTLNGN